MDLEKDKLLKIFKKIMSDKEILDEISNIQDPEKIFKIFQNLGYDKTFKEFCVEISKIVNTSGTQELSESDLDNIAGGVGNFKRAFLTALSSLSVMSSSGQAYAQKNNTPHNYQENLDKITININLCDSKTNDDVMKKFLKYTAGTMGVLAGLGIVVCWSPKLHKFISGNSELHTNFFSDVCSNLDKMYNKIKQNPGDYLELHDNNVRIKDSKQNDLLQDILRQFNNIGIKVDVDRARSVIFDKENIVTNIWKFLGKVIKNFDNSDNLLQDAKKFENNIKKISGDYDNLLSDFKFQNQNIDKKDEPKIIVKKETSDILNITVQEGTKSKGNIVGNEKKNNLNYKNKAEFQKKVQKVGKVLNQQFEKCEKGSSKSKSNSGSTSQNIVAETNEFKGLKQEIMNMKKNLNGQTKEDDNKKEEYRKQPVKELRKDIKLVKKQDGSMGIEFVNKSDSPLVKQKMERQKKYIDVICLLVGSENFGQISSNMNKDLQVELREKISKSELILDDDKKGELSKFIDELNISESEKICLKNDLENNNYVGIFNCIWKEMTNIGTTGQDGKVGITDMELVKSTTDIMDDILITLCNEINTMKKENCDKKSFFEKIYSILSLKFQKLQNNTSVSDETKKIIIYYLDNILYTVGNIQKHQNDRNYLIKIFKTIKANHNKSNKPSDNADIDESKNKNKYVNSFCVPPICKELCVSGSIVSNMFVRYSEGSESGKNTKSTVHQQLMTSKGNVMRSIYQNTLEFLGLKLKDLIG